MSIKSSVIVQKSTTKDESGRFILDRIVKLASHEDTLRPGKLFPAKCHKFAYEALERDRRPSGSWSHFYNDSRYYIAVKELIILWDDYQTDTAGFIDCSSCDDPLESCAWADQPVPGEEKASHGKVSFQTNHMTRMISYGT